ncbi:hypothetical protein AV530_012185 [Patagioenas fasciata monilis]|uniref:Uncharacterized protein n=1 Tax=Patagioenas fasciata monilis TaxID=372326 RepID=A0A1V4KDL9_PATFA|nr:hypothetical protein AV530_012185 [Patagioenas fasciata monilis]
MSTPAVGLIQSCHASCTDKACVGVKGSWKEFRLSQPAAAVCPDHTASALRLNSPVSTLFLLAQSMLCPFPRAGWPEDPDLSLL